MTQFLTVVLMALFIISADGFSQTIPKSAYVLNSVANTLSVINLENQTVILDILSPGVNSMPNHMVIRNGKGYVVNSGTNSIMVFDLALLQKIKFIPLPNESNPWAMDFINDSLTAVTFFNTDETAIVNVNTNQIIHTIQVGYSPEAVKYYNGKIYVANTGYIHYTLPYDPGSVSVIDACSYAIVDTILVGTNPQGLDVDSQGNLLVACTGVYPTSSGEFDIVDTNTNTVSLSISLSSHITAVRVNSADKAYLATYGNGVMVYDLTSQTFERGEGNPLTGGPGIAFDVQNNAYIIEFGNGTNAGKMRVFSPTHQQINIYTVNVGPVYVDVYDPASTNITNTGEIVADKFILYQNYPNPFNPATTIAFILPEAGTVTLDVFNLIGQKIRTICDEKISAGLHKFEWDGQNQNGSPAPSGIYFYRLKNNKAAVVRKMQLLR